jgi:hypothetical protein
LNNLHPYYYQHIKDKDRLVGDQDGKKLLKEDMQKLLSTQPDFLEQQEWLEQVVTQKGDIIDFYPKYHCELNWIERFWGWTKRYTREHCDFTLDGLRDAIKGAFEEVPKQFFMKWEASARRYIDAYRPREGRVLNFQQVQWATKKFSSHRVVEEWVFKEIDIEMEKDARLKAEKNVLNLKSSSSST